MAKTKKAEALELLRRILKLDRNGAFYSIDTPEDHGELCQIIEKARVLVKSQK